MARRGHPLRRKWKERRTGLQIPPLDRRAILFKDIFSNIDVTRDRLPEYRGHCIAVCTQPRKVPMKKLPFWIPLFLAILLAGCNLPGRGTQGGAPAPAEFDTFGSLASGDSAPISAQVGPAASVVQLGEGASLQVPAGAFSAPNTLQVTRVVVAFDQMTFDVLQSRFYEISTTGETGTLAAPVILEVPLPTSDVTVVEFDGQTWQPVTVAPGETTRVEIDHFSSRIMGVLEWYSEKLLALNQALDLGLPAAQ